jgi:hypothetical protein
MKLPPLVYRPNATGNKGAICTFLSIDGGARDGDGWTIQFHPPGGLLAGALAAIWLVTALAALYPARVASKLPRWTRFARNSPAGRGKILARRHEFTAGCLEED